MSVVAGPFLLAGGEPAGWTFLLMAAGLVLLGVEYVLYNDIRLQHATAMSVFFAAAIVLGTIGIVYFTRAANDLPSAFPDHDADSEHFRMLPGVMTLAIGLVLAGRAIAESHPTRIAA